MEEGRRLGGGGGGIGGGGLNGGGGYNEGCLCNGGCVDVCMQWVSQNVVWKGGLKKEQKGGLGDEE